MESERRRDSRKKGHEMNAIKQRIFGMDETLLCVCEIFAYYQPFERHLFDDDSDLDS